MRENSGNRENGDSRADSMKDQAANISVIICAYSEERWHDLLAVVASLQRQQTPAREILVVIDNNPALLERVQAQIAGVTAIENKMQRGLSGARNTGIAAAQGTYIAFFDDDVIVEPDCLTWLERCFANQQVAGVGGRVEPLWTKQQPDWFPREFYWVVGCSYRGLPESRAEVRNPIGCCCCFRREVFESVGGFREGIGRIGKRPLGCEETELCIRVLQRGGGQRFLYEPRASVQHRVPAERASWRYFCARCYSEGLSKAAISRDVGTHDALTAERSYVWRVLPLGVWHGLKDTIVKRDGMGVKRAGTIVAGLAMTSVGYVVGRIARGLANIPHSHPSFQHLRALQEGSRDELSIYKPVRVLEIELGQPLTPLKAFDEKTGQRYSRAYCLVRLHRQPMGMIEVPFDGDEIAAEVYAPIIWQTLGEKIVEHAREDGLPLVTGLDARGLWSEDKEGTPRCLEERNKFCVDAPFVSVIVPTHERIAQLQRCLQSLLALRYPAYEILVVDNAPVTDATEDFIRQTYGDTECVRYIREERLGASLARNRGIRAARGEILAFTDDDVVVDADWLLELVRAFGSADDVACVTGLVLPLEMETAAQFWFEEYGGFSKDFTPRVFDMTKRGPDMPLHPYTTGQCGSGVSMALQAAFLRSVQGFDAALGPGVSTQAGEDLALFFQVITHGYRLVYTPSSLLYHQHRREYGSLRQQMYNYGVGLSAYLTKIIYDRPQLLFDLMAKMPYGLYFTLSRRSPKNAKKTKHYPQELSRLELKGMVYGPFAYLRERQIMRQNERAWACAVVTEEGILVREKRRV